MKIQIRTTLTLLSLLVANTTFAQTEWTKQGTAPVLTKSGASVGWDIFAAADPSVIKDGDTLKIWYSAGGIVPGDTTAQVRIGLAWSLDGINWTKHANNPVFIPTQGTWDALGAETVTILKDSTAPAAERYRMWYAGSSDSGPLGLYSLGYAFSADGINWIKHPANPVLVAGSSSSWENAGPEGPTVIKDGDTLKMWYMGLDTVFDGQTTDFHGSIGYAWSLDGVNWTKHQNNPVLTVDSGTWDAANIQDPFVMKIGNIYHLWYSGFPEWIDGATINGLVQIGYAQSLDGINWTKSTKNPVLPRGPTGAWDNGVAGFPTIIQDGSLLRMWYTGLDTVSIPPWPTPYFWDIGYATAPLDGSPNSCCNIPGDASHDGAFNIADVTFAIARIFSGGQAPLCQDEADANGDNRFNIADVTFGIARIFAGGPAPICGTTGT